MTSVSAATLAATPLVSAPAVAAPPAEEGGFSFNDLLDIVNPLQHIPVVSTLYRAITGDTIKTFPKIAGDTLFGGVEGFASSMADTIFTKITGKSVGDTVLAFAEDVFSPPANTAVASTAQPAAPATASISTPAGEDFVDRAIDWIGHFFSPSHASANALAPVSVSPAQALPQAAQLSTAASDDIVVPGQDALLMALSRNGVGQDVALRAADAYRRTLNVAGTAAATALH